MRRPARREAALAGQDRARGVNCGFGLDALDVAGGFPSASGAVRAPSGHGAGREPGGDGAGGMAGSPGPRAVGDEFKAAVP
ncbi:MAG: hypothetical protein LBQ12_03575 [Deltaproteobacteria bacterium]|nr:hypothetical protein [Deltaproteobacteria bacterium]